MMEAAGLDPSQVETKATGGAAEGIAMLESGDIDLFVVAEPVWSSSPGQFKEVFRAATLVPAHQQTMLMAQPEYADDHPDVVQGVVDGYTQAVEFIKANPEEAARLWAQVAEIDEAAANNAVATMVAGDHWGAPFKLEALASLENSLKATVPEAADGVPWSEIIDQEFIPTDLQVELPEGPPQE